MTAKEVVAGNCPLWRAWQRVDERAKAAALSEAAFQKLNEDAPDLAEMVLAGELRMSYALARLEYRQRTAQNEQPPPPRGRKSRRRWEGRERPATATPPAFLRSRLFAIFNWNPETWASPPFVAAGGAAYHMRQGFARWTAPSPRSRWFPNPHQIGIWRSLPHHHELARGLYAPPELGLERRQPCEGPRHHDQPRPLLRLPCSDKRKGSIRAGPSPLPCLRDTAANCSRERPIPQPSLTVEFARAKVLRHLAPCKLGPDVWSTVIFTLDHVDAGEFRKTTRLIAWPTTAAVHAATRLPFESIDWARRMIASSSIGATALFPTRGPKLTGWEMPIRRYRLDIDRESDNAFSRAFALLPSPKRPSCVRHKCSLYVLTILHSNRVL
jgi:hypothetical protein